MASIDQKHYIIQSIKSNYSQINTFMSYKLSKYLTGFRKNHNAQHALLNIIENWKSNPNKGI